MSDKTKQAKNPKIRFKREDGTDYPNWEYEILSKLGTFKKGANLSKADICETGTPFILYGELYTTYGEIANVIQRRTQATVPNEYYSHGGEVLLPVSGETPEEISTATCVVPSGVILAGDLLIYRPFDIDGRILSYVINHQVKNKIARIAQGKTIVHISAKEVGKIGIIYPADPNEQARIASLFAQLDALVSATQDEVDGLQELKRTLLKQIFDQTVRFTKEDGTEYPKWESKKLRELSSYVRKMENGDKVTYVGTENLLQNCMGVVFATEHENIRGVAYQAGDILVGNIRPYLQKAWLANRSGVCSSDVLCIRSNDTVSAEFLYRVIARDSFFQYVMSAAKGSKMPRGDKEHIMDMKVSYPVDPEEQARIASLFESLDEAIHEAEAELEKYQELKTGLMQKMFV